MFNPDAREVNDIGAFSDLSDAVFYNALAHAQSGGTTSAYSRYASVYRSVAYSLSRLNGCFSLFHQDVVFGRGYNDESTFEIRPITAWTRWPNWTAYWNAVRQNLSVDVSRSNLTRYQQ